MELGKWNRAALPDSTSLQWWRWLEQILYRKLVQIMPSLCKNRRYFRMVIVDGTPLSHWFPLRKGLSQQMHLGRTHAPLNLTCQGTQRSKTLLFEGYNSQNAVHKTNFPKLCTSPSVQLCTVWNQKRVPTHWKRLVRTEVVLMQIRSSTSQARVVSSKVASKHMCSGGKKLCTTDKNDHMQLIC